MAKHIEMWLVDKLIPWARNPRTHSDAQVAQIAASIAEFGFNSPILVDSKAGILAGHGRLLAARKLGLTEVPVIVLDHLTEAQKRAYVIADNKLAENAGWNDEMLRIEIEALQDENFDVSLLGFEDVELAQLLAAHGVHFLFAFFQLFAQPLHIALRRHARLARRLREGDPLAPRVKLTKSDASAAFLTGILARRQRCQGR